MESICRPIFFYLMIPLWFSSVISLCLFHSYLLTHKYSLLSIVFCLEWPKHKNGVSKMSLFTPQSVAIEDTQIEIELCTEREFTSIAEIQANKWHAQPTQTHMHTTRKSPIFSSYWMWSILCHIYSIKKRYRFMTLLYVCVYIRRICVPVCECLCAYLCVTTHEK